MPVIGWLNARSPDDTVHLVAAFHRGLGEQGFVEGQNVTIESRWALGQFDRLPALAAELVGRRVTVLASTGGELAALAAKAATSTIPIVFAVGGDPVRHELATSYNRPDGNATGITLLTNTLEPKRLGLLRDLVPRTASFGVLLNPRNAAQAERQLGEVEKAARTIGLRIHALRASTDDELDAAFKSIAEPRITTLAARCNRFATRDEEGDPSIQGSVCVLNRTLPNLYCLVVPPNGRMGAATRHRWRVVCAGARHGDRRIAACSIRYMGVPLPLLGKRWQFGSKYLFRWLHSWVKTLIFQGTEGWPSGLRQRS